MPDMEELRSESFKIVLLRNLLNEKFKPLVRLQLASSLDLTVIPSTPLTPVLRMCYCRRILAKGSFDMEQSSSSLHAVETAPLQDTKSSDNRQVVREERTVASDGTLLVEGDPIKTGELKMPSFAKVCFTIIYGYWLKLGDYSAWNHNSKDSLLSELNNVALTAALMATVEFSIVYLLQDQPWLQAVQNLGFKNASQDDADAVYDFFMVL
eukprot:g1401.t1